jgi:hypothetical protein
MIIVYGGSKVAFFGSLTVYVWLGRRSKRLIQTTNFRLCPRCRYDLTSCLIDGQCPECGRAYTDADLRLLWRRAYRIKDPSEPRA